LIKQGKIEWKHDPGKIHVQNNKALKGTLPVKTRLERHCCFIRKSTVQFSCLANLPKVLRHYQHKQSYGTLRRSVG